MVNIRSVTYNFGREIGNSEDLNKIQKCTMLWEEVVSPHTQRINLKESYHPFEISQIKRILKICDCSPIRWLNVPLNPQGGNNKELFNFAYKLLGMSSRIFINIVGVEKGEIYTDVFKDYASLMHDTGAMDQSGVNNFRLGLSFNIEYNCPFFPFTRSATGQNCFTIALEMVEDINIGLNASNSKSLDCIQYDIISAVNPQIQKIYELATDIERKSGIMFGGFDFSLAPVISPEGSVMSILHNLGIYNFGHSGTLFATAFLTDILKYLASIYPSVGFSGVMYSLLEDLELCAINNERGITTEQLISLSTMCGCGLDMVPISSDIAEDEIISLCMDIAGISCKYNKPLGVRLLSIPNTDRRRQSFTAISEDSDFVANTRVVPLDVNILPQLGKSYKFMRH